MDVDPRAGVLPYRLYDAAGLPDHAAGLQVVAQNAVARRHRQRRVLCLRVPPTAAASSSSAPAVAVLGGAVVVVIAGPGPSEGVRIIVLVIVVVPLRSRPVHEGSRTWIRVQSENSIRRVSRVFLSLGNFHAGLRGSVENPGIVCCCCCDDEKWNWIVQ